MTCRSCGFENMKKSRVCARCGAKLILNGPVRLCEVTPRLRKRGRLGRFIDSLVLRIRPFRKPFGVFRRVPRENLRRGLASAVPGLGLLMAGETVRAVKIFAGWTVITVLAIAGVLTGAPLAAFGMSVSALIHAYAVIVAMRPVEFCRTAWEARIFGLAVSAAMFVVYTAASHGIAIGRTLFT